MQVLNLEFLYLTALFFTIMSFTLKNDDDNAEMLGKIFFFFFGGISWVAFALGQLKIRMIWGGSINVVEYTFTAINGEDKVAWIYAAMGILMVVIGGIKTMQFYTQKILGKKRVLV